jgi:phage gp36-like protein
MYSTIADLLKILPADEVLQLADDDGAGAVADPVVTAVLEEAIGQADSEIDTYVGTVREVPLSPVPAIIARLSTKLAVHNLYLRRHGVNEPEAWQRETVRCQRLLDGIAAGRVALGPEAGATAEPETGEVLVSAPDRIFTAGKWEKF